MRAIILAVVSVGVIAFGAPAAVAAPAAKPAVTFAFVNAKVTAGKTPEIRYSSRHLPAGAKIYLQRLVAAKSWRNVERLSARAGTAKVPAERVGKYVFRLRALASNRQVAASGNKTLYSYGNVSFDTLCNDSWGAPGVDSVSCDVGTVQIGDSAFTYDFSGWAGAYPATTEALNLSSTSCRTISIQFATADTASGATSYASVIQASAKAQAASTAAGTIGTLDASLNGKALIVDSAETNGQYQYFSGSASCYTASGLPQGG